MVNENSVKLKYYHPLLTVKDVPSALLGRLNLFRNIGAYHQELSSLMTDNFMVVKI